MSIFTTENDLFLHECAQRLEMMRTVWSDWSIITAAEVNEVKRPALFSEVQTEPLQLVKGCQVSHCGEDEWDGDYQWGVRTVK